MGHREMMRQADEMIINYMNRALPALRGAMLRRYHPDRIASLYEHAVEMFEEAERVDKSMRRIRYFLVGEIGRLQGKIQEIREALLI